MNSELPVLRPLRAIRSKCLDCSGGSAMEVRECTVKQCALYPYRMGKRPSTVAKAKEKARPSVRFLPNLGASRL